MMMVEKHRIVNEIHALSPTIHAAGKHTPQVIG